MSVTCPAHLSLLYLIILTMSREELPTVEFSPVSSHYILGQILSSLSCSQIPSNFVLPLTWNPNTGCSQKSLFVYLPHVFIFPRSIHVSLPYTPCDSHRYNNHHWNTNPLPCPILSTKFQIYHILVSSILEMLCKVALKSSSSYHEFRLRHKGMRVQSRCSPIIEILNRYRDNGRLPSPFPTSARRIINTFSADMWHYLSQ